MQKPLTQKQLTLISVVFVAMGIVIVLIGTGFIDAKRNAPGWVIALAGCTFIAAGLVVPRTKRLKNSANKSADIVSQLLGLVIIGCMGTICTWVGFRPGERQFSSSISVAFSGPVTANHANETFGRVVFGGMGALIDIWFIVALISMVKKRQN